MSDLMLPVSVIEHGGLQSQSSNGEKSVTRGCYGQRVTRISCFLCDIRDRCISNLFAS